MKSSRPLLKSARLCSCITVSCRNRYQDGIASARVYPLTFMPHFFMTCMKKIAGQQEQGPRKGIRFHCFFKKCWRPDIEDQTACLCCCEVELST